MRRLTGLQDFHISRTIVLLTITVYLIPQGIAPFLTMPFGEVVGRRPVFLGLLAVFQGANVGLMVFKGLVPFMVLRAVQAIGAAPLSAIGKTSDYFHSHHFHRS